LRSIAQTSLLQVGAPVVERQVEAGRDAIDEARHGLQVVLQAVGIGDQPGVPEAVLEVRRQRRRVVAQGDQPQARRRAGDQGQAQAGRDGRVAQGLALDVGLAAQAGPETGGAGALAAVVELDVLAQRAAAAAGQAIDAGGAHGDVEGAFGGAVLGAHGVPARVVVWIGGHQMSPLLKRRCARQISGSFRCLRSDTRKCHQPEPRDGAGRRA
jgi:hypothetical protein